MISTIACPNCHQTIEFAIEDAAPGMTAECPTCGQPVQLIPPAPPPLPKWEVMAAHEYKPPISREVPAPGQPILRNRHKAIVPAGILFAILGSAMVFIPFLNLLLAPFAAMLLLAALVLGVVAIIVGQTAHGILVVVLTALGPLASIIAGIGLFAGLGDGLTDSPLSLEPPKVTIDDGWRWYRQSGYVVVEGTVRNQGPKPLSTVKVVAEFFDQNKRSMDTDYTYVLGIGEELRPGGAKAFQIMTRHHDQMKTCSVHVETVR